MRYCDSSESLTGETGDWVLGSFTGLVKALMARFILRSDHGNCC